MDSDTELPLPPLQRSASNVNEGRGGRRHCWVVLPDVDPMAGVVAGWRSVDGGGWSARVAYVLGDKTGGVVTGWLPASVLRPHDASPVAAAAVEPAEADSRSADGSQAETMET